jgi:hypothetical protein
MTKRVVAVGVLIAPVPERARLLPLARITSSRPPPHEPCPGALGELLVTSEGTAAANEPLVISDLGRDGHSVVAVYSRHWSLSRSVTFFIRDQQVWVQAGTDTDIGDYQGAIDAPSSTVHLHGDRLCFDLSVELLDGGPTHERWVGQISLE